MHFPTNILLQDKKFKVSIWFLLPFENNKKSKESTKKNKK